MRVSTSPLRPILTATLVLAVGWMLSMIQPSAAGASVSEPTTDAAGAPRGEVFHEDFERAPDTGTPLSVRDYLGRSDMRFDADDFWTDRAACNGFILSASMTGAEPGDCLDVPSALAHVRALAGVLGILNGTDPRSNSVVAAYTQTNGPDGAVELETTTLVPLATGSGRFLTASVNVASLNCFATVPTALQLALRTPDGVEHPVSEQAIDPCTDDRAESFSHGGVPARAGHFTADASILVDATSIGVVMRNEQGSGFGNDHAFDDLSIVDVTPTLDVELSEDTAVVGETIRLRFVVRNTPELAAKAGWSVQAALPAGLTVAADPRPIASCSAEVTAPAPEADIAFTGDLAAGQESCTIEVDATPVARGAMTVAVAGDAVRGLDIGSQPALTAIDRVAIESPASGTLMESSRPTSAGTGEPGADITVRDGEGQTLCETTVDPSGRWSCASTVTVQSGEAVVRVEQTASGLSSTDETTYRVLVPALAVEGTVRLEIQGADGSWVPVEGETVTTDPGDRLRVIATVTNTGENALGDITLTETPGTHLACSSELIEPGTSAACTSAQPFVLTPAALEDGSFVHTFEAVLTGYSRAADQPATRSVTSADTGRLPLPDAPRVSTGALHTSLGIVWRVAPLEPQAPLARTGAEVTLSIGLLISGLLLVGGMLVGVNTRQGRRVRPPRG
ncbi:conserved repeat domain-containing protein [Plantibacter flavus]|uniref:Putative repeat protein (TIGR01451 family) n=1 Tax=Plantibacter flavus TaxID=150123 RepID=A0A3N2C158_9MICO|nr:Ig-like domain-containing protein [Plantibacter flavus]ROR81243.1 putative repeat protein (TIGR01451 family) [Plantibacter flavus]SMG09863.1 conserved repeat domain-containing protein [Plantibacter flavus]